MVYKDLEKLKEKKKQYRESHREQMRVYNQAYRQAHQGECNERNAEYRFFLKAQVLTHYGNGKCACVKCGFDDMRALSIDHVNGRSEDRKVGSVLYSWLRRRLFPLGYQTLCMNCQYIKRTENSEDS